MQYVGKHQKRHREGIHHRTDDDAPEAVNITRQIQKPGHHAVGPKQNDQPHAMGNGGDQHGQGQNDPEDPPGLHASAGNGEGKQHGQRHRNDGGYQRHLQGISHHQPKPGGGYHRKDGFAAHVQKHLDQRQYHANGKKGHKQKLDPVAFYHFHALPPSPSVGVAANRASDSIFSCKLCNTKRFT